MPVTVIPFTMPQPMAIPAHLEAQLRRMSAREGARRGMELLMQIEAAETMLLERIDGEGRLQLAEVLGLDGADPDLERALAAQDFYGAPLTGRSGLAGQAFERQSSLLVMGQAAAGEVTPLPPALARRLVGEGGGNVGFLYVLPLSDGSGRPLGALTLIRPASTGPLNHEQPNIAEAMRRLLAEMLAA